LFSSNFSAAKLQGGVRLTGLAGVRHRRSGNNIVEATILAVLKAVAGEAGHQTRSMIGKYSLTLVT
jgi:hypothetical protein